MSVVLAGRAVVVGLEGAVVVALLPVLHVHHAGAGRVVAHQHVVAVVVVDRGVAVHDLRHYVPAYFGEGRAEDNTNVSFEPPEPRHELMYFPDMVPLE